MGIGPGTGFDITVKNLKSDESDIEIIHRLAVNSDEPAIKDALRELHVLVKLYHADDIADEQNEQRRMDNNMQKRFLKLNADR